MRVLVKTIDAPKGDQQREPTEGQIALGKRLALVRDNAGITQEEWADLLGRSPQAVSSWETGRNLPAIEIILQYDQRLGVDLHWLLTGRRFSEEITAVQSLIKMLDV